MIKKNALQARWNSLRAAHKADMPALTIARARELIANHPECGPAWRILGAALTDMGRHGEAEQALKQALSKCPAEKLWIPLSDLGHLHQAKGDYLAAADWYRRAIEAAPDEAGGYICLGGVQAKMGRLEAAEASHRAALRCRNGCYDEAYLNLGLVLRAQERHEEAAVCFERALELDPKYAAARKALRDVRQTLQFMKGSTRDKQKADAAQSGPLRAAS